VVGADAKGVDDEAQVQLLAAKGKKVFDHVVERDIGPACGHLPDFPADAKFLEAMPPYPGADAVGVFAAQIEGDQVGGVDVRQDAVLMQGEQLHSGVHARQHVPVLFKEGEHGLAWGGGGHGLIVRGTAEPVGKALKLICRLAQDEANAEQKAREKQRSQVQHGYERPAAKFVGAAGHGLRP
jgi:hypothetical protein